ncbi:MAG: ligand-gated TonB-dependent outer membrane channel [Bacteroidota bacterium]|nr:MAG: TonB-dependent receptor [Bacteroidetes bacterium OLB12]GIL21779.1 MAG: ligand-gated TonB-dependent outer membrane channel [Bacteroidota bacterium]HNU42406.1 TonB-dependent receptor [Cyclobacteriaceae bacterium]
MIRNILVLLILSNTLFAQQDTTRLLQDVVVQSNRIQTGFDETSASIIVLKESELKQLPALSVSDLLHYIAGVDIRQRGANGIQADAGIRGSTFDQVLILINGIKISDAQTGHHSLNLPIDVDNIERIEVLKGPAARIFGQNAFAGAINIITKNPDKSFIKAQAMGGDFGLGGFRISAAQTSEKVKHYISAARDFSDGYQYNTAYQINNFFYQSHINTPAGKLNLLAGYTDRAFGANGFYASPDFRDQFETVQTSLAAITLQTQPAERLSLHHRIYWRRNQDDYIFTRLIPDLYRNFHLNNTIGYEANATINHQYGTTGLGVEVSQLWLRSTNLGDHERTVATFFAENRITLLNNRVYITPGIQVNYYSDFGANLLPGIDAGFEITPHLAAFANIGYTYRVPTYTDLYYSDLANVGNPDLQPEYAITYEGGLKLIQSKKVQGQVSYFLRNGKQIIDWTKEQSLDPWKPDNVIGVNMKGLDLNVTWKPIKLILFTGGYTYIDADKTSDANFSRYAFENLKHQVLGGLTLFYSKTISHTINYRYCERANLPDYHLLDTRLTWQGKTFAVFTDITNITDVSYKETNLVTMPGRWFKLGMSYRFE